MTIQEKLEPLTRWTEQDAQQWCRENPFVNLKGGACEAWGCLVAAIATELSGVRCGASDIGVGPDKGGERDVTPSPDMVRVMELYDEVMPLGKFRHRITAIEAAALMWPEVFADEAKRLVESAQEAAAQC
jgi:hypothetical protein